MPAGTTKRGALRAVHAAAPFPNCDSSNTRIWGTRNMPHRASNSRRRALQSRRGMYRIQAALACGVLPWGACFAQENPPAPASTQNVQAAGVSVGLEEVVVTATRRSEVESKVPISITAFTQKQ